MGKYYFPEGFDAVEEIARMYGSTGKIAYDKGISYETMMKEAERQLGNHKKWQYQYDFNGRVQAVVGKNGKIFNTSVANETVSSWQGANQMFTKSNVSGGTAELISGDIIDEVTGKVTKKGAVSGAISGANALMAGLGVLGGVATGVQWYKDNPDVWTDISNKLFQWTYADPYDKSWNDIFYDALVPTAIDSTGNTYLQEGFLQTLADALLDNGFYEERYNSSVPNKEYINTSYLYATYPSIYDNVVFSLASPNSGLWKTYDYFGEHTHTRYSELLTSTDDVYLSAVIAKYGPDNDKSGVVNFSLISHGNFTCRLKTVSRSGNITYEDKVTKIQKNKNNTSTWYEAGVYQVSTSYSGIEKATIAKHTLIDFKDKPYYGSFFIDSEFLALGGEISQSGGLDKTYLQPGAVYPEKDKKLNELYPGWSPLTTVNPNSTPDDTVMDAWYPVSMPDTANGESGSTSPGITQNEAQKGENTEETKSKLIKDLIAAIEGLVIPWDNLLPSDPEGTVPDKPKPSPAPNPDFPIINGVANALWKVYNPTIVQLKAFGSWLWSANPIEVIKKIFNNNPMDAIIGLHAIFCTPVTHGTENIKVGYIDSGVESRVVEEQYRSIDCGDVLIPKYYNNALDFGSTKVFVYLPFIGIHELNSYDVVGKYINITYTIDILTGVVLAQITVKAYNYESVLYTYNGSCSVEYPLTSGSRASQAISTIAGAIGGGMTAGVTGFIGGGIMGATRGSEVRMSGNLSGNAGAMGIRKPYIILKRPVLYDAFEYNKLYGYPANEADALKRFKGYTRVKKVHVTVDATDTEKKMIENALMNGVIIS